MKRGEKNRDNSDSRLSLDLGLTGIIDPSKTKDEAPKELENPFALLAEKEDWQALVSLSEEQIAGRSTVDDAKAKLWWIKGQFYLANVPISILAAPLDLISRDLLEGAFNAASRAQEQEIQILVVEMLEKFIPRLSESGDSRMAELFVERLNLISETSREASEQELAAVEKKGAAVSTELEAKKKARKVLTETERLRANLGIDPDVFPASNSYEAWLRDKRERGSHSFWRSYFVIALLLLAVVGVAIWWWMQQLSLRALADSAVTAGPEASARDRDFTLLTPEISRIENVNTLGMLLYNMDGQKKNEADQPSAGSSRIDSSADSTSRASQVPKPILPGKKERIDTSSPREAVQEPELKRDPLWGDAQRQGRSPFGDDDLRAYEVQRFPKPLLYRIVTDTLVLPRPILRAQPLQKLRAGDEVLVDAKIGYWLRLRSHSNKPGFILAQDAEVK